EKVRALSGEDDVEVLDAVPARVSYDGADLTPRRVIRIGSRFLVEATEHPGEWWMGELRDGELVVWGSYGSLEEAAAQH
ncbi:MAG TPA: hypothetical protein VLL48_01135, partial [Longimicrobiales bacterium]|nr:hypothetical protein [Longimicrobiales bacterium]